MKYDFDKIYERKNSEKWMELERKFGSSDLISFWEADMDFQSAQPVIDALVERAKEGIYGYPSKSPTYKEAVCGWYSSRHGLDIPHGWILHTPMVITAVAIYLRIVTEPGDGIILTTPMYYPFYDVIADTSRKTLKSSLKLRDGRYGLDFDDLEQKMKSGAKVMVLCNPHNPTGRVWTEDELRRIGDMCMQYGVKVIADEVHADFTRGENKYIPFSSLAEEYRKNCVTLLSPGKTFNLAGTKQAIVVIADEAVRKKFEKETEILDIDRNNCFSMVAAEAAYRYGGEWFEQVKAYIESNMDYAAEYFRTHAPEVRASKPEGTYLMWVDFRELGMTGEELNRFMVEKARVGCGEGMWFGPEGAGFERLTMACPRAILAEGLDRIAAAVRSLSAAARNL